MISASEDRAFAWSRVVVLLAAAASVAYGMDGLLRDDIYIPCRSGCEGTHYHGHLAWLMFGAISTFTAGVLLLFFLRTGSKRRLIVPLLFVFSGLGIGIGAKALADRDMELFEQLYRRGDALFAQARYMEAQKVFYQALLAANVDVTRAERAAARGTDSFCTGLFERAKSELANRDYQMALLDIDTALADRTCGKFPAHMKWAREQKAKLERGH
jgi:hypothetical protein